MGAGIGLENLRRFFQPQYTTVSSGTVAVTSVNAALPSVIAKEILIQNAPASTASILIGNTAGQHVSLVAGAGLTVNVSNLNIIHVKTASGTATLNYFALA